MKRYETAIHSLEEILKFGETGNVEDGLIVPHSLYELGRAHMGCGRFAEAEDCFRKAREYRKYDLRKALNFKLAAAVQTLEAMREISSKG